MQPPHQQSRINLAELKAQLVKKLGPEGSKQYFYYLNRFLSLKLSKVELDKLCSTILGRDNIPLHNQFIRSILKNACTAKAPPPISSKDISSDGYLQNGSHNVAAQANGGDFNIMENRDLSQGLVNENGISGPTPADVSVLRRSQDVSVPLYSKDACLRSPLQAPLGVPLYPVSIGGSHRGTNSRCIGTSNDYLLGSVTLREQMEQIATSQGLEGVSPECANILNHGLDSYMKGLIKSCIQLVGATSRKEVTLSNNQNTNKELTYMKPVNGVKPGFQYQVQNSIKALEGQEREISLQDFRVAMEMNPSQLGEDWPLLLEKICTNAFEE